MRQGEANQGDEGQDKVGAHIFLIYFSPGHAAAAGLAIAAAPAASSVVGHRG